MRHNFIFHAERTTISFLTPPIPLQRPNPELCFFCFLASRPVPLPSRSALPWRQQHSMAARSPLRLLYADCTAAPRSRYHCSATDSASPHLYLRHRFLSPSYFRGSARSSSCWAPPSGRRLPPSSPSATTPSSCSPTPLPLYPLRRDTSDFFPWLLC
jgi:hypothetical protein